MPHDEAIVVPTGQRVVDLNALITLNSTGQFIWERLREETTEEELTQAVVENFDIDIEQARYDVAHYLADLHKVGMIE